MKRFVITRTLCILGVCMFLPDFAQAEFESRRMTDADYTILQDTVQPRAAGYKGIWFTLGQFSQYGDKYSGGLGTYTSSHIPVAVYAPQAKKTFFVYGGTTRADQKHLLIMISYFDHDK